MASTEGASRTGRGASVSQTRSPDLPLPFETGRDTDGVDSSSMPFQATGTFISGLYLPGGMARMGILPASQQHDQQPGTEATDNDVSGTCGQGETEAAPVALFPPSGLPFWSAL
ncbi:hypothetical protein MTO96_039910 [Rhipicephalus appendiculatus]